METETREYIEQLKNATDALKECLRLSETDEWWFKGIWYWTSQIASLRESLRYTLKGE